MSDPRKHLIALAAMSLVALSQAPALNAQASPAECATFIKPGAVLNWAYFDSTGTQFNQGTFTVSLIDGAYIELQQTARSGLLVRFVATMAGDVFVAFNSDARWHEVLVGRCTPDRIAGNVRQWGFVITR